MDSLCRECIEKFCSWGGNPITEGHCFTDFCGNYPGRREREAERWGETNPLPRVYHPAQPQLDQVKAELLHVHDTLHQMQGKKTKRESRY